MNNIEIERKAIIIGGGAWGCALASVIEKKIGKSYILTSNSKRAKEINSKFAKLRNYSSVSGVQASSVPKNILKDGTFVIIASEVNRSLNFCNQINDYTIENCVVLIACKGFYNDGQVLPSVLKSKLNRSCIGVISGPSFASEVMEEKPTALLVAGEKYVIDLATEMLHSKNLRIYGSTDIIGTSVSGAMKNVIAIASGIVSGLGLGENARAAVVTRGLSETSKLVIGLGGKIETVFGLSGVGDIALSSLSSTSRNFSWGYSLAKNQMPNKVLVEGINAAKSAMINAKKLNIDMPITELVANASKKKLDLKKEIEKMLSRPPKLEW